MYNGFTWERKVAQETCLKEECDIHFEKSVHTVHSGILPEELQAEKQHVKYTKRQIFCDKMACFSDRAARSTGHWQRRQKGREVAGLGKLRS